MYRMQGDEVVGAMNDWDLARDGSNPAASPGLEYAGTIPFVALDLLKKPKGEISHQYHHDHEAMLWILLWVFRKYPEGKEEIRDPNLDQRVTGDYDACYTEKNSFLIDSRHLPHDWSSWKEWPILHSRLNSYHRIHFEDIAPGEAESVLKRQWMEIKAVIVGNKDLEYIADYEPSELKTAT